MRSARVLRESIFSELFRILNAGRRTFTRHHKYENKSTVMVFFWFRMMVGLQHLKHSDVPFDFKIRSNVNRSCPVRLANANKISVFICDSNEMQMR